MLWLLGVPLALVAVAFVYWQLRYPAHTYRYKLTVEVETPEGVRSGSAVREVGGENRLALLPDEAARTWWVKGQAVAVDLPNGRTLFALISPDAVRMSVRVLDPEFQDDIVAGVRRIAIRKGGTPHSSLRIGDYPLLVTFDDISVSTSVRKVEPTDLTSAFGEGYSLNSITIERTSDPVTVGIRERLGWLSDHPEPRLDPNYGGSTNPSLSERLSHGDFLQGATK